MKIVKAKMSFGIDRKVNPIHILEFFLHYRNDPTLNNVEATVEEVFLVWLDGPAFPQKQPQRGRGAWAGSRAAAPRQLSK